MESETGAEGRAREYRRRSEGRGHRGSDAERIGAFAARVLDDLYALVYGERPVGVRVWCDGSALLMLVRLAGPIEEEAELGTMLPCEAIPELVATAVRAQTGWGLETGSWTVEADLGLVLFVFRLPDEPPQQPQFPGPALAALATSAEVEARRAQRWQATHIPSWRAWTPVPSGGVAAGHDAAPERPRMRAADE